MQLLKNKAGKKIEVAETENNLTYKNINEAVNLKHFHAEHN